MLLWLGLFALAGATTYQFFRGRRTNLELMRDYVREIESSLDPVDKLYTLTGLYSGFKSEFKVRNEKIEKIEISLGLMPRESLLYYPISLLTLRHDRLYIVFRLTKIPREEIHIVHPKTLGYNAKELRNVLKNKVIINGTIYLTNTEENHPTLNDLKSIVLDENVLHVSLVPRTSVLYVFLKPRRGLIKKVIKSSLNFIERL
ncbi:membrane protein [Ignicoccus islandicus DSM 13165]|uniref:Membrane protein n=1 Tax=Ignicoccus islandicus DSM 13165 TaxID=940295 RepID=A0A0U3FMM4_9CREN|nr:hypothetical protein [Ignicoccus islandicus]ALU11631.1 membrane protein [Ignicoccus islandicus DSM 13165]